MMVQKNQLTGLNPNLNEAKLTAIGLTIRFVILQERPVTPDIKLLALDYLLISLDMQHRMQVIDIIFNEFKSAYKLILLTHDYGFYREVKRRTFEDIENWKYLEFYEDGDEKQPRIKEGKIGLEKAVDYLKNKDFQACAVELRKTTEDVLKNFCERKMEVNHGAHASDAPLYAQELQDAMETIKRLQNVLKNIQ